MSLMVSDGSIAATCEVTEAASVTDQVNEIGWSSASGSSCAGTSEVIWNGMFRVPPKAATIAPAVSSPRSTSQAPIASSADCRNCRKVRLKIEKMPARSLAASVWAIASVRTPTQRRKLLCRSPRLCTRSASSRSWSAMRSARTVAAPAASTACRVSVWLSTVTATRTTPPVRAVAPSQGWKTKTARR